MTCIIGYVKDGKTWMGCDSQITSGWMKKSLPLSYSKISRHADVIIGCAGELRMVNILKHDLSIRANTVHDDKWLQTKFVNAVRAAVRKAGYLQTQEGRENFNDNILLVGIPGSLYTLNCDFCLSPVTRSYHAIGVGGEVAMGVLWQMEQVKSKEPPAARCEAALMAASDILMSVSPPFHFECVGEDTNEGQPVQLIEQESIEK